jgi:hypothetical protein
MTICCGIVQELSVAVFMYVLVAYYQTGLLFNPHQKLAASWIGYLGLMSCYLGLVPTLLASKTKTTIQRSIKASDPALFKTARPVRFTIDRRHIKIENGDRNISFDRSAPIQMIEDDAMAVLVVGGTLTPFLKKEIDQATYTALDAIAEKPRPDPAYFSKRLSLEKTQLAAGILLFILNTWLRFQIFHGTGH